MSMKNHPALRRTLPALAQVVVESLVLSDLLNRHDLSRPRTAIWYWWISSFPRTGCAAYLVARPGTRERVARLARLTQPRAHAA